jgi:hypothetical protein
MTPSVSQRVRTRREALRAAGPRPMQIWVPDPRQPGFAEERRRQSALIAEADAADIGLHAFMDAALSDVDEDHDRQDHNGATRQDRPGLWPSGRRGDAVGHPIARLVSRICLSGLTWWTPRCHPETFRSPSMPKPPASLDAAALLFRMCGCWRCLRPRAADAALRQRDPDRGSSCDGSA